MKIVFLSCYLSHHQLPLCQEMYRQLGDDFCFVATESMKQERVDLGYQDLGKNYSYVVRAYESADEENEIKRVVTDADVVIIGSAPLCYIQARLKQKKLTFCYSERLYKSGFTIWKYPIRLARFFWRYGRYKSFYLLCASAYTAGDFAKTFTFLNKAYKWGYFPEVKRYDDFDALLKAKEPSSILWAGRFIDWKHPEYVVEVARRLREDGYSFRIGMLGNGEKHEEIQMLASTYGLDGYITFPGAMSPEQVRSYMEKASIYLFTSDRQEGWGAVLNESMNSGCAVVASDAIGAVPFLIDNGSNGMIFPSGDVEGLYQKVKFLLDHPEECSRLGENAYTKLSDQWNAETAAERVINLSKKIIQGEKYPDLYETGPCSKAKTIKG